MTIEEDFALLRSSGIHVELVEDSRSYHAALDRIEAERRWLWDGLKIHGEDFAACRQERAALKAALKTLDKQVHICGVNDYRVSDCPGCQVVRPALAKLEEK